jgi:hypothetical protein
LELATASMIVRAGSLITIGSGSCSNVVAATGNGFPLFPCGHRIGDGCFYTLV